MSAPFFVQEKDGYRLSFSKALYPPQALAQLKELYDEGDIKVVEKDQHFEVLLNTETEEDCLDLAENFLLLARKAKKM